MRPVIFISCATWRSTWLWECSSVSRGIPGCFTGGKVDVIKTEFVCIIYNLCRIIIIIIIIIINKDLTIEIQRMWNVKNKGDTSNKRGDWNYFKVIQKIREKNTTKTWRQGNPENSHIGHCTHTLREVLMSKYNRFNTITNDISTMNSSNRIAAILYSLGT